MIKQSFVSRAQSLINILGIYLLVVSINDISSINYIRSHCKTLEKVVKLFFEKKKKDCVHDRWRRSEHLPTELKRILF